jgi:hypothetical protein
MIVVGYWNELDRSYSILSCDAIKEVTVRSSARLGSTVKIIVKQPKKVLR